MTESLNSGVESVDSDYASLKRLLESEDIERLAAVASDENATPGDVFSIAGTGAFRLARVLLFEGSFHQLEATVARDSIDRLKDLREHVVEKLEPLFQEEPLKSIIESKFAPNETQAPLAAQAFKTINHLTVISSWVVVGETVTPTIRFQLGSDGSLLLDSTVDWDDAIFVANGLLRELAADAERFLKLTAVENRAPLRSDVKSAMLERLELIRSSSNKISEQLKTIVTSDN